MEGIFFIFLFFLIITAFFNIQSCCIILIHHSLSKFFAGKNMELFKNSIPDFYCISPFKYSDTWTEGVIPTKQANLGLAAPFRLSIGLADFRQDSTKVITEIFTNNKKSSMQQLK
jgi:hypothetical protein